jgi:pimeloyl-ACP methyl ester carboxylesterase
MPGLDLDDPAVQESIRSATPMSMAMLDQMRRLSRDGERAARLVPSATVIIQGTRDTISLPRHTERMAKRLSNLVGYHAIPADHMLPFEGFPSWSQVRGLVEEAVVDAFPELRKPVAG